MAATPVLPTAPAAGGTGRVLALPVPVLLLGAAALAAVAAAGPLVAAPVPSAGPAMTVALAASFLPLAVLVLRRVPRHPIGRLMLLVGGLAGLAAAAVAWSGFLPAAWLSQWLWLPAWALIPVVLLLVPDGRLPSRRWRPLLAGLVAAGTVLVLAAAAAAAVEPRSLFSGEEIAGPARSLLLVARGAALVTGAAVLGVLASLGVRWRRADRDERGQLACLAPAGVLLLAGVGLDAAQVPFAWVPAVVAFPLGLTVAVLRYRFHDLDLHIHRGTVWAVLTGFVVAVYVGVATLVGATVAEPGSPTGSVVAAATVAALLQPAHWVAQRGVRRLLYGRRDEPYAVLTELGRSLEGVRDPLAALPRIAESVVTTLRVPYAAVRVVDDDGSSGTAAEHGRWAGEPAAFPMVAHGAVVGELLVAPRTAGARFTAAEARLLRDLAGQAAQAAHACRSALALQRARDRLVLAREEERRRLRRDLHDGVASALVGTRLLAEAARRTVAVDGPAPGLLDALAADLDGCTAEVRELIDGLRPAALDAGLGPALDGLVARFGGEGPEIALDVGADLDDLPAAVEVAAYRIVAEALTNVVKHAGAAHARIVVGRDDRHLAVTVTDDGRGLGGSPSPDGVGLTSVHDRAGELGGRAEVTSSEGGGTTVAVLLPLRS
ncbi:sensor histidine kinase [Pseudonocardia broussonetiae]|uniref:Oxygen sensor histidine kinase NreB n=1 Tax=Pseudonocardia broussonetiae TaxID=2736640 RepID=A0A6M6JQ87_9PSEU|nr:ATP-binding protein [Pseudonocardia broussonetiae]QJY50224.1 sensor histidine kinase [Pseudonocardia broussonetiae]